MFIIDKPYVSDLLKNTIKKNNFQIIATEEARSMIPDKDMNWISEEEAVAVIKNDPQTTVYSNSENAIYWINKNLGFTDLPEKISFFKNKVLFRNLIRDQFPGYYYRSIRLDEIEKTSEKELKFPFIIKPAVGFFSLGVYTVEDPGEWKTVSKKIRNDVDQIKTGYPEEVVSFDEFIIEAYIRGDEFAVDAYFDRKGEPVILNILHHIFSSGRDVSDRVYTSSIEIIEKHIEKVEDFLQKIGKKTGLKNFPVHMEVRIDNNDRMIPIELNPFRFGGWCTTGDLSWYAYGINSYEFFIKGIKPDWEVIKRTRKGKKYSLILLDNGSGIDADLIESFDYKGALKMFSNPMVLRKIDFHEYPVFGFIFTETTSENEEELDKILHSDLKEFIRLKTDKH